MLPEILKVHKSTTIAIDIMCINKVSFFISTSRNTHLRTVEALTNQHVGTIIVKLKAGVRLYKNQGLEVTSILADSEFEPLRGTFPYLNCGKVTEHITQDQNATLVW